MSAWTVNSNLGAARAAMSRLAADVGSKAPTRIAAKAAKILLEESLAAFRAKKDPKTGNDWSPPSEATRNNPDFESLLVSKSHNLRDAIRSGFRTLPNGALAFVNAESLPLRGRRISTFGLALIHLYGVKARNTRSWTRQTGRYAGKRGTTQRKRPEAVLPARRFVGMPPSKIDEIVADAEREIGSEFR